MKKYIFALLGTLAMAFIPTNVNAASSCDITVASGETKTIDYYISSASDRKDCHITNFGTLNITAGTSIYADTGYVINNRSGIVNMTGGIVSSALHQAIWSNGGTVTIKGGTLESANGHEENIYFASAGSLNLCGNYSYDGTANVTNVCPKPAPAKTQSAASTSNKETVTITIATSEKKTETPKTTVQSTSKTQSVAKSQPVTNTAPKAEEKTEVKAETKTETKAEEKPATTEVKTELPSAGKDEKAENNNTIAIVIAATIAVLGSTSAAMLINRLRA